MTSRYRIERSRAALRDLASIFRFLIKSHMHFGDTFAEAKKRAAVRMAAIKAAIHALGALPHKGTRRDNIMRGMRSVTKQRAILYFTVDEERRVVRVLAVFFGGQDHQNIMLQRLLARD